MPNKTRKPERLDYEKEMDREQPYNPPSLVTSKEKALRACLKCDNLLIGGIILRITKNKKAADIYRLLLKFIC
ncbi:MAG: hypothetical protein EA412_13285 [Chitinophagaceae bacterium]|nr:MAG: hypothetical protein EA412_13285 [Chitinophagaceae bacterium]